MPLPQAGAAPSATVAAAQPTPGYRNAVAHAAASVVSVYGAGELPQEGLAPAVQTLTIGSGVILDRSGFVVTNGRLFEGAQQLMVALADGTPCEAALVGFDAPTGIALNHLREHRHRQRDAGDPVGDSRRSRAGSRHPIEEERT